MPRAKWPSVSRVPEVGADHEQGHGHGHPTVCCPTILCAREDPTKRRNTEPPCLGTLSDATPAGGGHIVRGVRQGGLERGHLNPCTMRRDCLRRACRLAGQKKRVCSAATEEGPGRGGGSRVGREWDPPGDGGGNKVAFNPELNGKLSGALRGDLL